VFKDISEEYKIGKYTLALTDKNKPEVIGGMYSMINIWKEPIQSTLP